MIQEMGEHLSRSEHGKGSHVNRENCGESQEKQHLLLILFHILTSDLSFLLTREERWQNKHRPSHFLSVHRCRNSFLWGAKICRLSFGHWSKRGKMDTMGFLSFSFSLSSLSVCRATTDFEHSRFTYTSNTERKREVRGLMIARRRNLQHLQPFLSLPSHK